MFLRFTSLPFSFNQENTHGAELWLKPQIIPNCGIMEDFICNHYLLSVYSAYRGKFWNDEYISAQLFDLKSPSAQAGCDRHWIKSLQRSQGDFICLYGAQTDVDGAAAMTSPTDPGWFGSHKITISASLTWNFLEAKMDQNVELEGDL